MFRKILVCTDFSAASKAALLAAVNLARKCEATLYVVHVLPKMEGRILKVMSGLAQKDMGKFFLSRLYAKSRKEILFGDSKSQAIVKFAKQQNCEIIVMGSKGRTAIGDLLVGSVTQQVTRIADVPVMVVPDGRHRKLHFKHIRKMLVATDFSDVSSKALHFAIRLAHFLSAQVHILHVLDSRVMLYSLQKGILMRTVDAKSKKAAYRILASLPVAPRIFAKNISTLTRMGDPPKEIAKYADQKGIGLIVMGTHGSKGLERILIGSVTATVLSKSKVPVITISARYSPD